MFIIISNNGHAVVVSSAASAAKKSQEETPRNKYIAAGSSYVRVFGYNNYVCEQSQSRLV